MQMQRLSGKTLGFWRRYQPSFIASSQSFTQRDFAAASTTIIPNQHLQHGVSRSSLYGRPRSIVGVKSENLISKRYKTIRDVMLENENYARDGVSRATVDVNGSHRDGTIYKRRQYWVLNYNIDVTDRDETQVEPMRFTAPTNCHPDPDDCDYHSYETMVQVFSLKLAKASIGSHSGSGLVKLYGYIAARDDIDSKLNYVFNRSRDDPVTVQQGSLIEMTGPKRGIALSWDVLFEFDMRIIKNGEEQDEEKDLQLIDGITRFYEMQMSDEPLTVRIDGDAGAVDMCLTKVYGVEATVETFISKVENEFDLSIC